MKKVIKKTLSYIYYLGVMISLIIWGIIRVLEVWNFYIGWTATGIFLIYLIH